VSIIERLGGVLAVEESGAGADGLRWYAVRTLPRRESGAFCQLQAQGFSGFLPQIIKTVRHARKIRTVRAPFFPSYLFVQLDLSRDRWLSVNGTFGVARMVMAHDRPAPVPIGVIEALLEAVDERGVLRLDGGLQVGQRVEVVSGPFAKAVGVLARMDDGARVRVLLDIMGGQVPVSLSRESLRAA